MSDQFNEYEAEEEQLNSDEEELLKDLLSELGESRRQFLGQVSAAGLSVFALQLLAERAANAAPEIAEKSVSALVGEENTVAVKLKINGVEKTLNLDSRVTLLDALRERVGLTG